MAAFIRKVAIQIKGLRWPGLFGGVCVKQRGFAVERNVQVGRVRVEFYVSNLVKGAATERVQTETGSRWSGLQRTKRNSVPSTMPGRTDRGAVT